MTTFDNFRLTTYLANDEDFNDPAKQFGTVEYTSIDEAMAAFLERVESAPDDRGISHYLDVIDPSVKAEDRDKDVTHVLGAHHAGLTRLLGTRVQIDFTASHGLIEVAR